MIELLDYRSSRQKLRNPGAIVTQELINSEVFTKNVETMKTILAQDGVGLAATQVNWPVQLFMLCIDEQSNSIPPEVFLNARVVTSCKKHEKFKEGCLSFPGLFININRPETITWEFDKLDGTHHTKTSSGFYARAVQHEIDHCMGRVFIDHASATQMLQVKRWLDS